MKVIVKGGTIVTPIGSYRADVLIENGVITNIGKNVGKTKQANTKEINARDCLIFPGLVDPHVHMGFKWGEFTSSDDFESGTRAAAYGGVTTIIDFAVPEKEESLDAALNKRLNEANGHCYVDFGIHVAISEVRNSLGEEIQRCIKQGVFAFRLYTVYSGLKLSDKELYTVLRLIKEKNGLARVHAENYSIIEAKQEEFVKKNLTTPYYHYLSRPDFVEEEAVARLLIIQKETDCPIYFNHISTKGALYFIQQAKSQGQQVFAETCPQYLFLSASLYQRPTGYLYLVSPSLKEDTDRLALWRGLELGIVDAIGTDHCPYTIEQKKRYADNFTLIPNGMPGVETTLPLLFTEWLRRKLPLEKLVALISLNPARIFRLYPRKGVIQPGADGDIVVFDPRHEWEIRNDSLHMNVDWNPYEGFKCTGKVRTVLLRGKVLIEEGEWQEKSKTGRYIFENLIKQ